MASRSSRVDKLKRTLVEVRERKDSLSPESYGQVILLLLEKLRHLQTQKKNTDTPIADEIRLVSVMFIDIVNSTHLAQQMDTGDWKSLLAEAHSRLSHIVTEWDGKVGQYLGDGLLCFFGAQRSRSNDALRTVSCAVAVQEIMTHYAEEVSKLHGLEFSVRIGISTGRVTVGMIGAAGKQEFLALGPATNLAARLQSLCPPGAILVDNQTYSRIRNHFVIEARSPIEIKGFKEPVFSYMIKARRAVSSTQVIGSQIAGISLPFVGHKPLLEQVLAIWNQSIHQEMFHVVSIYGEIGLGKSRFVHEIVAQIVDKPVTILRMVARYEKRHSSYNLLHDLFTTYCNLTKELSVEEVQARIANYVKTLWAHPDSKTAAAVLGYVYLSDGGYEDNPQVQSMQKSGQFQDRMVSLWLSRWLQGIMKTGPLLIVIDNLQWADSVSLSMLEQLGQDLQGYGGTMLLAARPEFRSENSQYMQSIAHQTSILMPALDSSATDELIQAIVSRVENVPDTVIHLIRDHSDGNPLFILEFLAMLFDNEIFERTSATTWKFNLVKYHTSLNRLPQGLLGVLQARLDELPDQARIVMQAASTVGHTFWSGVIDEMLKMDSSAFCSDLVRRGMILRDNESSFEKETQYQFHHSLYREVAYGMLPRAKREAYHHDVAGWLVVRVAGKPEYFSTLAEQFEQAAQHEVALFTYLEAAQNRLDRGLLDETLILIEHGLAQTKEIVRDVALPIVCQLWTVRSQTYNELDRFEEASAASESALRLLKELPENQLIHIRALAGRMLGQAYQSLGRYNESMAALQRAFELFSEDDRAQQALMLRSFGSLSFYRGRLAESQAYQQRAYSLMKQNEKPESLSASRTQLGLIALEQGDVTTALDFFEQVYAVNQKREHIRYQMNDLQNIGTVYMALMAYDLALENLNHANEMRAEFKQYDPVLEAYRGLCLVRLDHSSEGMQYLEQAVVVGHPDGFSQQQVQLSFMQALVLIGDFSRCIEIGTVFVKEVQQQNLLTCGRGKLWLGLATHALGDPTTAKQLLQDALKLELKYGGRDSWLCHQALALTSDDPTEASKHLGNSRSILRNIGSSLHSRPDLQAVFQHHELVQTIMDVSGEGGE